MMIRSHCSSVDALAQHANQYACMHACGARCHGGPWAPTYRYAWEVAELVRRQQAARMQAAAVRHLAHGLVDRVLHALDGVLQPCTMKQLYPYCLL